MQNFDLGKENRVDDLGKMEIITLDTGDIIVGETHLYIPSNLNSFEQQSKELKDELESLEEPLLIVENDMLKAGLFNSPFPTPMEQSIRIAKENNIEVLSLDTICDTASSYDRFERVGLDYNCFVVTTMFYSISEAIRKNPSISLDEWVRSIHKDYNEVGKEIFNVYKIIDENKPEELKGIIRKFFVDIDARLRDQVYAEKIVELKKKFTNKEFFIVVGKAHMPNIERALKSKGLENLVSKEEVEKFKENFDKLIKEVFNTDKSI